MPRRIAPSRLPKAVRMLLVPPRLPNLIFLSPPKLVRDTTCSTMPSKPYPNLLCLSVLLFSSSITAFAPFAPESAHKCYFLDGIFDKRGGPCYGGVGASMCCYSDEQCDLTGLCLASPNGPVGQYDHNKTSIWRRSCTDETWQDPACFAIGYGKPLPLSPSGKIM